jgi:transposase-like protein
MTADLQDPIFTDENAAREALEAIRWPHGVVCAHCGAMGKIGQVKGKSHRPGLYYCGDCKGQFTVTVGTVFERSKIPLTKWLLATHLLSASKKGISSHQIHRMLGVTYKSAWFMTHRIREAMRTGALVPMGGGGAPVEVDETYIGTKEGRKKAKGGYRHKRPVLALVERGGEVRSFHIENSTVAEVAPIVRDNLARESVMMTDESNLYTRLGTEFADHQTVRHGIGEYGRGDIHTNTIEGVFSIFKRGMNGVYHHCGEHHLHRYLAEFDFRYNSRSKLGFDDTARAAKVLRGAEGKRLTYQQTGRNRRGKEAAAQA